MIYRFLFLIAGCFLASIVNGQTNDELKKFDSLQMLVSRSMYSDAKAANQVAFELLNYAHVTQRDSLVVVAHNKVAGTYWILGDLIKSFSHLDSASQLSLELKNSDLIALNQVGMGNLYMTFSDFESAIKLFHSANRFYNSIGEKARVYITFHNIGRSYLKLDYLDSAKKYLDLTYQQYGEGMERYLPLTLHDMADIRFKMGLIDEADSILSVCLEKSQLYKDKRAMAWALQLRSRILLERNQRQNAVSTAREAYSLSEQIGSRVAMALSAEVLSKALKLNYDFKESIKYLELSNAYNDSLQLEALLDRISIVKYNKTLEQLDILEQRNELIERESRGRMMAMISLSIIVVVFIVFTVRLVQSKKEIRAQREALDDLNRFKNQIFSIVGHDLQAPLVNLAQMSEMIQKNQLSVEKYEELMPDLMRRVDGLSLLISNLFDWAKTNTEGAIEKIEAFNLFHIVSEVIQTVDSTYSGKGVEILNQLKDDLTLESDKRFIKIVIRNVLVNAVKFSYPKGTVQLSSVSDDRSIIVSIQDHGRGMTEKQLIGLFQLKTGSVDGTEGEKGSGLGLVLCKDLLQRLGGKIWAESEENEGATFFIQIPTDT